MKAPRRFLLAVLSSLLLSACGGGGGNASSPDNAASDSGSSEQVSSPDPVELIAVQGMAVKGPLKDAIVSIYAIDSSRVDFRGQLLAEGFTDANAALVLDIDSRHLIEDLLLIEYRSGLELNDTLPALPTLRSVMTARQLLNATPVYATPLTTLVVDHALKRAGRGAAMTTLNNAISEAAADVKASFGLGLLGSELDLFTSAPVLSADTAQLDSLAYRVANEVFAAVLDSLKMDVAIRGGELSAEQLIPAIAEDMLDGSLDGAVHGRAIAELALLGKTRFIELLTIAPESLIIPGTDRPISDLNAVVAEEAARLAPELAVESLPEPELATIEPDYSEPELSQPESPAFAEPESGSEPESSLDPIADPEPSPAPAPQPINVSLAISWDAPTEREDGTPLELSEIAFYEIYYYGAGAAEGVEDVIRIPALDKGAYVDSYLLAISRAGEYHFAVSCEDSDGVLSEISGPVSFVVES
jgi:hypothetical protein